MRRLLSLVTTLALAIGTIAVIALPSTAVQAPVAFTAQDLPTWQTNGVAWAVEQADGLVFVGGQFTAVRPPGSNAGENEVSRVNLVVLDAATGTPTSCAPEFTLAGDPAPASVRSLAVSPDKKTLYVGGYFSRINGAPAQHLAAIDIATCTVINSFKPLPNSIVHTITATADTVYYGGLFTIVAGQTRRFAAAATAVGTPTPGALLPWAPTFDNEVLGLGLSPDGSAMAVGGRFDTANGVDSHAIVVVDTNTGANVHTYGGGFFSPTSVVKHITTDATGFYSASEGTGGGIFDGRTAYDWGTYNQRWRDTCLGATQAVVVYQGVLYSGSHAHDCSSMGEYPDGNRHHLLAESVNDPTLLGWFPNTNEGIGEQIGPRAMVVANTPSMDYMYAVGEFTKVNGVLQQGITRFGQGPGSAAPSKPTVSVTSVRPGEAQIAWRTSLDNDDIHLTYKVYRDNGTTPIYTTSADSVFWNQPQLSYVDTNLILGSTHSYRVTVTDNDSIVSTPAKSVVITSSASNYAERVDNDGASFLWRYDEPSDTFFSDYTGHGDSATLVGPATYQVSPGAIGNDSSRALGLGGASTLYSSNLVPSPSNYSVETWFRTTSTSGGKIIGFGDHQSGDSSNYDKHVYMTNNGKLIFGAWIGSAATVTSPASYNDGGWHHLVATQGSAGMALYVDGVRVGKNSTTTNQAYSGYWRVGGDNLNGWPSQPSSSAFTGDIDETAVYPTVLSASTVAEHYQLAGGTIAPSGPSDFYGKSVYAENPTLYWRLGEGSGSTAADASGNGRTGTYGSNVTYNQTGAVSGTSDRAVRFNGNSNGRLSLSSSMPSPANDFSVEAWFKTTSSNGGEIIGFGNAQTGNSSTYDRMIYVRNDGRVVFGTYNGSTNVITTSSTYRDGSYHHVVGTQSASGMAFYIDGNLVGTNPATSTQNFTGYWRIGDNLSSWPSAPSSNYLNGTIDEVAVYDAALSAGDVASHYSAGNSSVADKASPTAPSNVTVGMAGGGAQLGWQAATDNVGVTGYEIHRSSTLGFTPSPSTLVGTTSGTSYTDNDAPAGTVYYRVIATDAAGNKSDPSLQSSVYVPDTVAPAAPANVTVGTTSTSASVSWEAATDNIGVAQYDVYRSATSGFVPGPSNLIQSTTGTSIVDTPIGLGTWYYVVKSRDAAGNTSTGSTEVSGIVADTTPPGSPAGVTAAVAAPSVGVTWTAATDDVGPPSYRIYRSATSGFSPSPSTLVGTSSTTSFLDTNVPSGIFYYRVIAIDGAGNTGIPSAEAQAVVPPSPTVVALSPTADTYANQGAATANYGGSSSLYTASSPGATSHLRFVLPAAPAGTTLTGATLRLTTNSTATAGAVAAQSVRVGSDAWDESTLNWNNRPAVNGAVLGSIGANSSPSTTYTAPLDPAAVTPLVGTQATIAITNPTTDSFWFWSSNYGNAAVRPQLTLTFTAPDTSAPLAPNVTATPSGYNVGLSWPVPLDNVGVTGYDVYRSTTAGFVPGPANHIAVTTAPSYADGPLAPGTYYYRVTAHDAVGNTSNASAEATVVVADSTAPSAPADLLAAATPTSASLSWTASTDNVGVTGYDVYRSTTAGFVPGPSTEVASINDTSYEDSPLDFGTYYYRVVARDAAGNASAASEQATAVVADTTAPTVPTEVATSVSGSDVTVTWEPSGDDVQVNGYRVYRSATSGFSPSPGTLVGSPTGASFLDASVPAGTWYYRVVALDTAGNTSTPSDQASAVVLDSSPPSVPTGVNAAVTGASIDVTWTASTDDGVVTGYDVYRSDTSGFTPSPSTLVGSVATPHFVDSPVGLGTWYYRIVAKDGASHVSDGSAEISAVVSDIAPPSAPTDAAASVAGADVTVTWTASTDDVAVTGYDVYRSDTSGFAPSPSTLVGSETDTDFVDTGRPAGTWYYVVVAKDAQSNRSTASDQATALVGDHTAPSKPTGLVATPSGSTVALTWTASTDDIGVTGYDIYRSATSGFTPAPSSLVGTSATPSWNETSVPAGTWYYRVVAHDAAANASDPSNQRVVVVAPGSPTVVNLTPTEDTYGNAGAPTSNYGISSSLMSRGSLGASSYLRFNVPAAPAGTTLTGVSLRIRTSTDPTAGSTDTHNVSLASNGWTETGLTWNNRPALNGSPIGAFTGATAATGVNTTYTTALDPNALLGSLGGPVTLAVTSSGTDSLWFWSQGYANAAFRPQLTLTYGPDTTAPSVPGSASAPVVSGHVELAWNASTDNVAVAGYDVHRSAVAGFTPSAANLIASVTGTSYADAAPSGTWYYRVVARDGSGNGSEGSTEVSATIP